MRAPYKSSSSLVVVDMKCSGRKCVYSLIQQGKNNCRHWTTKVLVCKAEKNIK